MAYDIREIGDQIEPELRMAFYRAVEAARRIVSQERIVELIRSRNQIEIDRLAQTLASQGLIPNLDDFRRLIGSIAVSAAVKTTADLGLVAVLALPLSNALSWLEQHAAATVTGIGYDTMMGLRSIAVDGFTQGIGAPAMGRRMRAVVGLLPAHADAVERYDEQMKADGVPEEIRARHVETYRRRLLAWRAENIARTETMIASHAGLMAGWKIALAEGRLPSTARMRWVVTDDDRLCERCAPMDGKTIPLVGDKLFVATHRGFPDGMPTLETPGSKRRRKSGPKPDTRRRDWRTISLDGRTVELASPIAVNHPPLHPSCRCTMVLDFTPSAT